VLTQAGTAVPEPSAALAGRFEVRARVGEGAFGVVYEVWDQERGARLALKELHTHNPDALLAFKREFRALQDLEHPNLVRFFELVEHAGRWFFTMEYVPGTDLLEYVASEIDGKWICDHERLRSVTLQLARGLTALHTHGMIHRDVKPSNVRVTKAGHAMLLDFGLVAALARREDNLSGLAGTAAYMAPEQFTPARPGPAADAYAVGAVLYQALTGRMPFEGAMVEVVLAKSARLPPPPSSLAKDVPSDLNHLCMALLATDERDRPGIADIGHLLRGKPLSMTPAGLFTRVAANTPSFVGREREQALLDRAAREVRARQGLGIVTIEGESGVGKTDLVREVASYHIDRSALVLWSRCHERETVPYNALDGAMDTLALHLARANPAEVLAVLPAQAALLPQLFPVLGRIPAASQASAQAQLPRDPVALRTLLFGKLRELLVNLAKQQSCVLVLDDLQWADAESLSLLDELLRPPQPPALLVLAIVRPREATPAQVRAALERWAEAAILVEHVSLEPLSSHESEELVRALLPDESRERIMTVVREAGGHPLFLDSLARYARSHEPLEGIHFEGALGHFLTRLSPAARSVLQAVCLAGIALRQRVLGRVVQIEGEALLHVLSELSAHRLLRVQRTQERDAVEPYHERIRAAVVASIDPAQKPALHRLLARSLETEQHGEDEGIARHWHEVGELGRASAAAMRAGEAAMVALAFGKAASLYTWALELGVDSEHVHAARLLRAQAFDRAGHASRAADAYRDALLDAEGLEAIELRRQNAQHLLRAGRIDEGLAAARELLALLDEHLPASPRAAMAGAIWEWLKRSVAPLKFVEKPSHRIDLVRADTLYSLSSSLGPIAAPFAAYLGARHMRAAYACGEPGRAALACMGDAFGMYFLGRFEQIPARVAEAQALAARSKDPLTRGTCLVMEGCFKSTLLEHQDALRLLREAESTLTEHSVGIGWLLQTTQVMRVVSLFMCGNANALRSEFPSLERRAMQSEDPYARAQVQLYLGCFYHLAQDRPQQAHAALDTALAEVKRPTYGAEDFMVLWMRFVVDSYAGDPQAPDKFLEGFKKADQSGLLRLRYVGQFGYLLKGTAELIVAARAPDHASLHMRRAKAALRALRKVDPSRGFVLEAVILRAEGDALGALSALERVEGALRAGDDLWIRLVVRLLRADLLGGDGGASTKAEVLRSSKVMGISEPERFLRAWIPMPIPTT